MILFLKCPSLGFVKGHASVCLACEYSQAQGIEPRGARFGFCIQHDRQASSFILSEGTPGHTAFYCCDCLVDQASLDLQRGVARHSFMYPSPSSLSLLDLLQGTKFKAPKSFRSEARSRSLKSVQKLFSLCPSDCDILWQMARLGTEVETAEFRAVTL